MEKKILEILRSNSRIAAEEMAVMLGTTADVIRETIQNLENKGVILGYDTLIDWEKTECENVTAYIEVKVTPQRGQGFDKVAERVY